MALSEVDRLTRPRVIPADRNFSPLPDPEPNLLDRMQKARKNAVCWLKKTGGVGERSFGGIRRAVSPAFIHLQDHFLTIASFACADWAAFLWNEKSGLITAAVLLIAFEMKVSKS